MAAYFQRMDFAHIDCKASILVSGYPEDVNIEIGCFGYYVKKDGKNIIVDTGIEDIDTVNATKSSKDDWHRTESAMCMDDNLKSIGLNACDVDEVYITHSHYDHISSLHMFTEAVVYMSQKEYEYLMSGENPHCRYLKNTIEFLEKKKNEAKLVLIDKEFSKSGIECTVVGGHTPGSMLVCIDNLLFSGDAIFLLKNIEENKPIGFCNEPENALRALRLCLRHKGYVLTGHDLKCPGNTEETNV